MDEQAFPEMMSPGPQAQMEAAQAASQGLNKMSKELKIEGYERSPLSCLPEFRPATVTQEQARQAQNGQVADPPLPPSSKQDPEIAQLREEVCNMQSAVSNLVQVLMSAAPQNGPLQVTPNQQGITPTRVIEAGVIEAEFTHHETMENLKFPTPTSSPLPSSESPSRTSPKPSVPEFPADMTVDPVPAAPQATPSPKSKSKPKPKTGPKAKAKAKAEAKSVPEAGPESVSEAVNGPLVTCSAIPPGVTQDQVFKIVQGVIDMSTRKDPWKQFRDSVWKAGFFKVDRWPKGLLAYTHERFQRYVADRGRVFTFVCAVLSVEPNTVGLEKMFRMVYVLLGWRALTLEMQNLHPA